MHTYATDGIRAHLSSFMIDLFDIEKIRQKTINNPSCMLVATYKKNLVGVAEIAYNRPCPIGDLVSPELNKLYVFEHFTGYGIGKQLLDAVEQVLIEEKQAELWLLVYAINDRAVAFYERQSYK